MTNYGARYLSPDELNALPFASIGEDVLIHERVTLVGIENISLGSHVRIDADVTILATGMVTIGSYVHLGAQCYLAGRGGIDVEDFAGLSQGVKLYSSSDDYSGASLTNPTVPEAYLNIDTAPIRLGRHAIIGAGSIILPGIEIAAGCAIGCLSLVKASTDPWGVYVGTPATRKAERKRDLLVLEAELQRPRRRAAA